MGKRLECPYSDREQRAARIEVRGQTAERSNSFWADSPEKGARASAGYGACFQRTQEWP